jgi:hypothetical protein
MVTGFYTPGAWHRGRRYMLCKQKVSHKSEMAGLFSRGDTILNKSFPLYLLLTFFPKMQVLDVILYLCVAIQGRCVSPWIAQPVRAVVRTYSEGPGFESRSGCTFFSPCDIWSPTWGCG